MNKNIFKRIVAVVLSIVLLASVGTVAFAAKVRTPVVVVNGMENNPLFINCDSVDAEQVWPPEQNILTEFEKGLFGTSLFKHAEVTAAGVVGIATNDYQEVMNYFVGSKLFKEYETITLNPDGSSKSGDVGPVTYPAAVSFYNNENTEYGEFFVDTIAGGIGNAMADRYGANNVYIFTYDWRLDPVSNAMELDEYIKQVKQRSNSPKVKIISEGFGSVVACTYLATCLDDATEDVSNFVTVNSAFQGTSLVGDFFTGRLYSQITKVTNYTSAFVRYTNDVSDNPLTAFSTWLVNYILNRNWETQDLCSAIAVMMSHIKQPLYDKYLRQLSQSFLGLWALVPTEYYEDALEFMHMNEDQEEESDWGYNEEMLAKIERFKNIQADTNRWINAAKRAGIAVEAVSSWDLQLYPIGDNSSSEDENFGLNAQSDGMIDTHYSSFGASCVPLNDLGKAATVRQAMREGECKNHNHLSSTYDQLDPDGRLAGIAHYIDASTCIMPDNTWFIHNMKHGTFEADSNAADLLVFLLDCDKYTTVYTNGRYNQFLSYNRYLKPGVLSVPGPITVDTKYLLGDVNLDGKVQANDARYALRISAKLEPYPDEDTTRFKNADVDGDGRITVMDARIILRVSAKLASFDEYYKTAGTREEFEQSHKSGETYVRAQVEGEKINIYICKGSSSELFWQGSFVEPSNTAKTYVLISKPDAKDKKAMDNSLFGSSSTALEIAVVNNKMKVKVRLNNKDQQVTMDKVK